MTPRNGILAYLDDLNRQVAALQRLDRPASAGVVATYSGTPAANEMAYWTGAGTVAGAANVTLASGLTVSRSTSESALGYDNVRMGTTSTPRLIWENATPAQLWETDVDDSGNWRLFVPGTVRLSVTPAGVAAFTGAVSVAGTATFSGTAIAPIIKGGTGSGDDLILESTNHATKGDVRLQPNGGVAYVGGNIGIAALIMDAATTASVRVHSGGAEQGAFFSVASAGAASDFSQIGDFIMRAAVGNLILTARNASGGILFGSGAADTQKATMTNAGLWGFGVTVPQGKLHIHDGTSGKLFVTKTGVVGSAQTVIPDGTGDVTKTVTGFVIVDDGTSVVANTFTLTPGSNQDIAVGTYTLRMAVSAGGALTVIRQAGTGTATVTLDIVWK